MLIEIQCNNFSKFDSKTGQYLACGEKLIVSDELIGQFVNCTKCSQQVEVPYGVDSASIPTRSSDSNSTDQTSPKNNDKVPPGKSSAKRKKTESPGESARPQSIKKPERESSRKATGKKQSKPEVSEADELELKLAEPVARQRSDVMSMDFAGQPVQSTLTEDSHARCSKCGNISEGGRCTVCRYVEQKFEKLHQPLNEISIELVGFQRWFCQTMNEGVSIKLLEYGAHIGLGLLAAGFLALAIASIAGIAFGLVPGILIIVGTIAAVLLYVGLIYKGKQFRRDPRARLAWFQKPFWNFILWLARSLSWENYDSSLKDRRVIKVREKMFGDNELPDLEGLKNCQVLDLQGTSITDRGLLEMYSLKHLQCLVLKRTNVSHDAVFRLQQSFPRLWIWY